MTRICYRRHRFPAAIIQHAIWLYWRLTLSYRDVHVRFGGKADIGCLETWDVGACGCHLIVILDLTSIKLRTAKGSIVLPVLCLIDPLNLPPSRPKASDNLIGCLEPWGVGGVSCLVCDEHFSVPPLLGGLV